MHRLGNAGEATITGSGTRTPSRRSDSGCGGVPASWSSSVDGVSSDTATHQPASALRPFVAAAHGYRAPPEVRRAWRLVFASDGRMRVTEIARRLGWSRQHLTRRFRQCTGITPKEAARIARFEAARRMLSHGTAHGRSHPGTGDGLAAVALACGYADQPHLSREWRALAGCSPGTWLREELPFLQDAGPAPATSSTA